MMTAAIASTHMAISGFPAERIDSAMPSTRIVPPPLTTTASPTARQIEAAIAQASAATGRAGGRWRTSRLQRSAAYNVATAPRA
jgi:hypothetical protein